MNKRALEVFAPTERNNLKKSVERRLTILGISPNKTYEDIEEWMNVKDGVITINGTQYINTEPELFRRLFKEYKNVGYDSLIEETAYTWFNRLMAIRYMEIKGVLPDLVKIIGNNGIIPRPEILSNYQYLEDRINTVEIEELKVKNEEAAYRKLFLEASNKLGDNLPFLFKPLDDWMELLLPSKMLEPGGIIDRIVSNEGLTNSFEEGVEAIGWLYQFYISEIKGEVLKLKKVKKELVPPRTQIFTKKWVVQYMVDNSLGQLWIEANPESILKDYMEYYVEKPKQTEDVMKQLDSLRYNTENIENITFLDPACGSGHILSYAFDLFYEMYRETGYSKSQIPSIIIEKNLFGMDLDERAAQLASFTLLMKAAEVLKRSVWRRSVQPNIISIKESNQLDKNFIGLVYEGQKKELVHTLIDYFYDAKEYGSLLLPIEIEIDNLMPDKSTKEKLDTQASFFDIDQASNVDVSGQLELLQQLILQYKLLHQTYDVVVANPPYMGSTYMSKKLSDYAQKYFSKSKGNLFSMFMDRIFYYTKEKGFCSNVTMEAWMFLSTFAEFRKSIISAYGISDMVHMDNNVMGIAFGTTAAVFRKSMIDIRAQYMYVYKKDISKEDKPKEFPIINDQYSVSGVYQFSILPDSRISYWITDVGVKAFKESKLLEDYFIPKKGMDTGSNKIFLRRWFEISINKFSYKNSINTKWYPYNKGGGFRRWYGNNEYVLNWENDGKKLKNYSSSNLRNKQFYLKPGITWSTVSSGSLNARLFQEGFLFDNGGSCLFKKDLSLESVFALLNSKVAQYFIRMINPTINYQPGSIGCIPYNLKLEEENIKSLLTKLVNQNVELVKKDWDSMELSWDFVGNSLTREFKDYDLEESYAKYKYDKERLSNTLKENEEKINELIINIYELEDSLDCRIQDKDLSIKVESIDKSINYFLSYFIGCWLGRYSIDHDGIAYAGGEWSDSRYKTFRPSADGIITFTDEKVLPDEKDIYEKLKQFLISIYGESSLYNNLEWLANGIGKRDGESNEKTIRNYFISNFYKDHLAMYTDTTGKNTRPIYWPIDSGDQKGMYSFIYLHRYTPQTMGLAMNNHFVPLLSEWRSLAMVTENEINSQAFSNAEKKRKMVQLNVYEKRIKELEHFQDKLHDIAREEIQIDLDDGVKANYQKFKSVLTPIKMK